MSEVAYQLMKAGKEMKRDMEYALVRNQASSAGGAATARTSAGIESWITNRVLATGSTAGTTPGFVNGIVAAPTDGTDRSFVISAVLYLNDDFTGGEIVFPNLDFEYKPKAQSLVVFQGYGIEYLHEVKTLTSGKRYTIPLVFTKDKQYEVNLNQGE